MNAHVCINVFFRSAPRRNCAKRHLGDFYCEFLAIYFNLDRSEVNVTRYLRSNVNFL